MVTHPIGSSINDVTIFCDSLTPPSLPCHVITFFCLFVIQFSSQFLLFTPSLLRNGDVINGEIVTSFRDGPLQSKYIRIRSTPGQLVTKHMKMDELTWSLPIDTLRTGGRRVPTCSFQIFHLINKNSSKLFKLNIKEASMLKVSFISESKEQSNFKLPINQKEGFWSNFYAVIRLGKLTFLYIYKLKSVDPLF